MTRPALSQSPLLLTSILLCGGVAQADDSLIHHLNNHLEGSIGAEHLSYSELNGNLVPTLPPGSDLDTESGTIAATAFSAAWQGRLLGMDQVRGSIGLGIATGDATYNGYQQDLQSGALTPLRSTTNETYIDLEPRVGKGFALMPGGRDLLTPYFGLGFTAWNRELTGSGGYTEKYEHFDWTFGSQYQIALGRDLALSVDAGFGKTFSASMTSSILPNTFDLGSSWMQRYDLSLRYRVSERSYMGLDGWWAHYDYGRSPTYAVNFNGQSGTVTEPDSKTVRDGLLAVIGYSYR